MARKCDFVRTSSLQLADNKSLVLTSAGIAAAAALYLDGKYHIRHDLRTGNPNNAVADAMKFIAQRQAEDRLLVYHFLEAWALEDRPNHLFLSSVFENKRWTYKQFFLDVQRVGNWLLTDLGIEKDEVVALDGPNSCGYLLLWFALEGIDARPAFINNNLTGESLQHCVKVSHQHQQVVAIQAEYKSVGRFQISYRGTRH